MAYEVSFESVVTGYVYDDADGLDAGDSGRLVAKHYYDNATAADVENETLGTPDETVTYEYDARGRQTEVTQTLTTHTRVTRNVYDDRGRLLVVAADVDGDGDLDQQLQYDYDPVNGRIERTSTDDQYDRIVSVTDLNLGIAARDQAQGAGYIMYSEENVQTRFAANPPSSDNSSHFVAVTYEAGVWYYDADEIRYSFTPVASDLLVADLDFDSNTVASTAGRTGSVNGIEYGYQVGDLTFLADAWNGSAADGSAEGEYTVAGSYFLRNRSADAAITDTHYSYDTLGRLDSVTVNERFDAPLTTPEVTDYVYDLVGNLAQTHLPNGVVTDYEYDALNRLDVLTHYEPEDGTGIQDDYTDNDVLSSFNYSVRADGKRTSVAESVFNGTSTKTTQVDWLYDNIGRLTREVYDTSDNSPDFTADYLFDLIGNRLAKNTDTDSTAATLTGYRNGDPMAAGNVDQAITYDYDISDRLLSEALDDKTVADQDSFTRYEYGPNADFTTDPADPFGGDHTTQTKKTVWNNLTGTGSASAITDFGFNPQGRMDSADVDLDADGNVDRREEYEYDDSGIRVAKTEKIDSNDDGTVDTTNRTDYHVDKNNHTGYAQVLEEMLNGTLAKTYTIGHDVFAETIDTGQIRHLLKDGHGSTRQLVDAIGALITSGTAQVFAYDAYGLPIGFDLAAAITTLLYNGEHTNQLTGLQYLRARWYDAATGRFNRLDPFAGNLNDPQSLHKYLYTHANPVSGRDPSGRWALAIAMGALVGGAIGYAIGGWDGMIYGALIGGGMVALFPLVIFGVVSGGVAALIGAVILGLGAFAMKLSNANEWDFMTTYAPTNLAIVTGDLGFWVNFQMWLENTSLAGFASDAKAAGHIVSAYHNPDEAELATILEENDVVVVVSHGPGNPLVMLGDYYDIPGDPFTGLRLGGEELRDDEKKVTRGFAGSPWEHFPNKAWVTAKELDGEVNNPHLNLAVAGCRVGKTNRLSEAIGIDPAQGGAFAAYNGDLNPAGVKHILYYARDYLNHGPSTAGTNFNKLGGGYVLNPTNSMFP